MNDATAVKRKTRAGDGFTFYSSHHECYALGIHSNTPSGREHCRYEPRDVVVNDQRPAAKVIPAATQPLNVKSKISPVVHAVHETSDAYTVLCGIKIAGGDLVNANDFPVTCKKCIKLASK